MSIAYCVFFNSNLNYIDICIIMETCYKNGNKSFENTRFINK